MVDTRAWSMHLQCVSLAASYRHTLCITVSVWFKQGQRRAAHACSLEIVFFQNAFGSGGSTASRHSSVRGEGALARETLAIRSLFYWRIGLLACVLPQ